MSRVLAVTGFILVAFSLNASEVPVSAPRTVPASYTQWLPLIASNGREFLAIWRDDRENEGWGWPPASYFSRLTNYGVPVTPLGRKIELPINDTPAVASNGSGYLFVYRDGATVWSSKLDDAGDRVGEPTSITQASGALALVANGTGYLLLVGSTTTSAFLLDDSGRIRQAYNLTGTASQRATTSVSGEYHVFTSASVCDGVNPCTLTIKHYRIGADDRMSELKDVASNLPGFSAVTAAGGLGRIVVAIDVLRVTDSDRRTLDYEVIDSIGGVISTWIRVADAYRVSPSGHSFVDFDGRQFLVGWLEALSRVDSRETARGIRVALDGHAIDIAPLTIAPAVTSESFASSDGESTHVFIWTDPARSPYGDLFSRSVSSFDDLAAPASPTVVALSSPVQSAPALAFAGGLTFVAWSELDAFQEIRAAILRNGRQFPDPDIVLAPSSEYDKFSPAVTAGSDMFLAAWSEVDHTLPQRRARVLAKRVGADGVEIDRDPIVLSEFQIYQFDSPPGVTVAYDGAQFLVVWTTFDVRAARLSPSGLVIDQTPIVASRGAAAPTSPRAFWNGQTFSIVWFDDLSHSIIPEDPPWTVVRLARVTGTGDVVETANSTILWSGEGAGTTLDAAFAGDKAVITWETSFYAPPCIYSMTIDRGGTVIRDRNTIVCHNDRNSASPRVAWDGSSGFVFWLSGLGDATALKATRLDASGVPSADPITIVSEPSLVNGLAAIATPEGIRLALRHVAGGAYGNAVRLFLDRFDTKGVVRRRGVRH